MTGAAGWTTLPVALSNGDGTFRVTNTTITNFGGWAATPKAIPLVGDFNDDGRADVALTGASGWNFVAVAFSNGDGSFTVTNITNAMTTILRQDRISGAPNAVLDSKVVTASMATTRNHVLNKADSRMIRRLLNTNP